MSDFQPRDDYEIDGPAEHLARELSPAVVALGKIAMEFAKTDRFTRLHTGELESDTDHTVSLALIACSTASTYFPELNIGKVAQYAIVHDLVEVYASDTETLTASAEILADKEIREAKALVRIKQEFGESLPWIHTTIESYEEMADPEARYVKILDKITPSISHFFNDAQALRSIGMDNEEDWRESTEQGLARIRQFVQEPPTEFAYALRVLLAGQVKTLFQPSKS